MSRELEGMVAIVTGGGRGIGQAHCMALAAAGARVVVNDLGGKMDGTGADTSPADSVVADICAAGGAAIVNYGNVTDMKTGSELVEQALDSFGRLDILINNAGNIRPMPFVEMTEDDWDIIIAVHMKGHFAITRAVAPVFLDQRSGRIINTSSDAGFGVPAFSSYGAAKEGITGLTRALAAEFRPYGVTVNQIRPRTSTTRMFDISIAAGEKMGAALTETISGASEQGLFARPQDFTNDHVGAFAAFLCSPAAAKITNGDFAVGGGEVEIFSKPGVLTTIDWQSGAGKEQFLMAAAGS